MDDFLEVVLTEDLKFGGLWSSQDIAILSTAKYLQYLRNAGRIRTSAEPVGNWSWAMIRPVGVV